MFWVENVTAILVLPATFGVTLASCVCTAEKKHSTDGSFQAYKDWLFSQAAKTFQSS